MLSGFVLPCPFSKSNTISDTVIRFGIALSGFTIRKKIATTLSGFALACPFSKSNTISDIIIRFGIALSGFMLGKN
jgi:hypothetical protein